MLELPEIVRGYYIYTYTFLDDLSFIRSPEDVFEYEEPEKVEAFVQEVRKRFLESGWEGDGKIGIIWFPPFVDVGAEDTYGTYVWHVKQSNNGISFIASEYQIDFDRLRLHNEEIPDWKKRGKPVNIIQTTVDIIKRISGEYSEDITACLEVIQAIQGESPRKKVHKAYLTHSQNMLVGALQDFLDNCYLKFLVEAIDQGNPSKINIRKSKVNLNPVTYVPEDVDEDGATWFTLKGIVSDMWRAYKFEPFSNKLDMLFKSVEYVVDRETRFQLMKHVLLRNCIQHHGGQLEPTCLTQCGVESFSILTESGIHEIQKWKMIEFTLEELQKFCEVLMSFAEDFNIYIHRRIPTRHYIVTYKDRQD
jgi:hypothetical protein